MEKNKNREISMENDYSNVVLEEDTTNRFLGKKKHKCRICGEEGLFETYLAREMMQNTRDEFEYFACDKCGCLQISRVPDNLGNYYGKDYYSFSLAENKERIFEKEAINHDKVLDVGCGSGEWLVSLAEAGYDNLWGCDPFVEKDIQHGDRVYIRKCTIHDIKEYNSFKLIRMSDSFEHVSDPLETLKSAEKLLADDGFIVMDIPTFPNIAFDMFGPHWYQLDAPRHLYLHSRKSINYLAQKSGLEVLKFEYNSNSSQILRSFLYQNGIPFYEQSIKLALCYFSKDEIKSIEQECEECNNNSYGDHMKVYLRKTNVQ